MGLRTVAILFTVILLALPISGSSALPAVLLVVKVAVAVAGPAWTGFNLMFVGARSAAFAQADEVWVSDPPDITRTAFDTGNFNTSGEEWNRGIASAVSVAPASAPSGNAITVRAETNWEPIAFTFSDNINMIDYKVADENGVIWGQGFAVSSVEGIVTKEYKRLGIDDKTKIPIAEIPLRYVISDIVIPHDHNLYSSSLDMGVRAWIKDDQGTNPEESNWHERLLFASVSLDTPDFTKLEAEGDLNNDDFVTTRSSGGNVEIQLHRPIEREVVLRVPFPDTVERLVVGFQIEINGAVQLGKN
jgi:hypothetical protein